MEFSAAQIAALTGGEVEGNLEVTVSNVSKIEEGKPGTIGFLANPKYEGFLYDTDASVVLISKDLALKKDVKATLIRVEDPYSAFTKLLEEYEKFSVNVKSGVSKNTEIAENASIGDHVYIGSFTVIGSNTKIGNNVKIFPQCYIGDNVIIEDNTIIFPGVKIMNGTRVGKYCTLQPGAVLGSSGFGFAPQSDGSYKRIPQLGVVILEDHVDIGANTTIDCATMGETVIHKGAKLDNLIQIAHNVEVGENTVMAAQSGVSGSSKIGKNVTVAGQVGISGHITIGDKAILAAQAGVPNNIPEGFIGLGSPILKLTKYKRAYAVFKNLPELKKLVDELEKKVINLSASKE